MLRTRIIGTGSSVPAKALSNRDLEEMVDTSDDWITTRTGIKERRISSGETTADIAFAAACKALESAGVASQEIDLVIVATVTPDMVFPSTACLLQSRLGIKAGAPAFDISAACSGFLYALDVADKYVRSGGYKNTLLIGVDLFSRIIDWSDRNTCVLFGDGAGAMVLRGENGDAGILSTHIHSDGNYWDMLYAMSPLYPVNSDNENEKSYLRMRGNETFKLAVNTIIETCTEALRHNNISTDDIALFIPHQANSRIIRAVQARLGLPDDKVYINLDKYGNTSAGSVPLAFDEVARSGRLKRGDIILFAAFGGGLTWASALVRW